MRFRQCLALLLLAFPAARAQDERRVVSPDGRLEFRIFVAQPEPGALYRLGYRLLVAGKPAIETSFLGLDIHNQEPVLCENVGLINSSAGTGDGYRWLIANYMQNGSLGRLVNLEIRVWNDGAAFRYVLPRSTPLEDLLIDDELTEFDLAQARIDTASTIPLPFVARGPGIGWVAIAEAHTAGYPQTQLFRTRGNILVTHLSPLPNDFGISLEGHTPFTTPWRVILIGADRERVTGSPVLNQLNR
ncbi:MAG: glycoside hydrolase family 97 N-terminal domain-containing protein [Candidatus Sulfopaludibacter sp.]|nr:glycoside hydrolase family 97 N-terminal domain-containing protein [Candidatus Sulfopaludibacter sp.]